MNRPDDMKTSAASFHSNFSDVGQQPLKGFLTRVVSHLKRKEIDWPSFDGPHVVSALTYPDVTSPMTAQKIIPCFCLKILDTGGARKKALGRAISMDLGGVSGLILKAGFPLNGVYHRIGCF